MAESSTARAVLAAEPEAAAMSKLRASDSICSIGPPDKRGLS